MKIHLIVSPYDCGRRNWRLGAGAMHWLDRGIVDDLHSRGHDVTHTEIVLPDNGDAEIAAAFDLARGVADEVRTAVRDRKFPVVLAGTCGSSWGTVAALRDLEPAVIWLDAHGDLNTPETTRSGFLDGMSLGVLTGRCWRGMAESIEGLTEVRDRNVVLVGARDLDPAERVLVDRGNITLATHLPALREKLEDLRMRCRVAYVHVDLDVIDSAIGRANKFAVPGGLSGADILTVMRLVQEYLPIAAVNMTAFDPALDVDHTIERIGLDLLRMIPEVPVAPISERPAAPIPEQS